MNILLINYLMRKKRIEIFESQTAKDILGIRVIRKEFDNAN